MSSYKHIILFFVSVYSASAFVPSQRGSRVVGSPERRSVSSALGAATTDTTLFYKDHPHEDLSSFATTDTVNINREVQDRPPSTRPEFYLPRHSDENAVKAHVLLGDAELMLGRFAMVAAILFLGVEIMTGTSLPDQLARLFG